MRWTGWWEFGRALGGVARGCCVHESIVRRAWHRSRRAESSVRRLVQGELSEVAGEPSATLLRIARPAAGNGSWGAGLRSGGGVSVVNVRIVLGLLCRGSAAVPMPEWNLVTDESWLGIGIPG